METPKLTEISMIAINSVTGKEERVVVFKGVTYDDLDAWLAQEVKCPRCENGILCIDSDCGVFTGCSICGGVEEHDQSNDKETAMYRDIVPHPGTGRLTLKALVEKLEGAT